MSLILNRLGLFLIHIKIYNYFSTKFNLNSWSNWLVGYNSF